MSKPPVLILCGGQGTRLGELTKDTPKPLVEVAGNPFLLHLLNYLVEQGFSDITLLLKHLPEKFKEVPWVNLCKMRIGKEGKRVSTEIFAAAPPSDPYWVLNGDTLILNPLPECDRPTILTFAGVSAGAIYHMPGRLDWTTRHDFPFIDMGTPEGLAQMERHLKC